MFAAAVAAVCAVVMTYARLPPPEPWRDAYAVDHDDVVVDGSDDRPESCGLDEYFRGRAEMMVVEATQTSVFMPPIPPLPKAPGLGRCSLSCWGPRH